MTDELAPRIGTVEQAYELFRQHMKDGKAKHPLYLDQRGLSFLEPKHHNNIGLGVPDDCTSANGKVFLKAVY